MSLESIQSSIYKRFDPNFTGGWDQTTFPVVAQNQPWPGNAKKQPDKPWGRVSVRLASSRDTSVDAKARRVAGLIWLQIFVPEDKGSIVAQKMGDELERLFGRKTIAESGETIRFERAVTDYVGKGGDGWDQHRSTVGFISDAVTP
jgi:hypothetical protein